MNKRKRHLILTVHGIRTYGGWQNRLNNLLNGKLDHSNRSIEFGNYRYGFFSLLTFIVPFLRVIAIRKFRTHLVNHLNDGEYDRVDIVAHSFGTYIVARAIAGLNNSITHKIHTIIFSGSVLQPDYNLSAIIGENKRVKRVINDCGIYDNTILFTLLIPGVGMGGRLGLHGIESSRMVNRYFALGHSGYFTKSERWAGDEDAFMIQWWVPLLVSDHSIIEAFSDRPLVVPLLERFWRILGENGAAFTLSVYSLVLGIIFGSLTYLWLRAEHEREIAHAGWLASEANAHLETHPQRSLLLAIQATKRVKSATTFMALRNTLRRSGGTTFNDLKEVKNACLHGAVALVFLQDSLYMLSDQSGKGTKRLLRSDLDVKLSHCTFDNRFGVYTTGGNASVLSVWDLNASNNVVERKLAFPQRILSIDSPQSSNILLVKLTSGHFALVSLDREELIAQTFGSDVIDIAALNNSGTGVITSRNNNARVWRIEKDGNPVLSSSLNFNRAITSIAVSNNLHAAAVVSDVDIYSWRPPAPSSEGAGVDAATPEPLNNSLPANTRVQLKGFVADTAALLTEVYFAQYTEQMIIYDLDKDQKAVVAFSRTIETKLIGVRRGNDYVIALPRPKIVGERLLNEVISVEISDGAEKIRQRTEYLPYQANFLPVDYESSVDKLYLRFSDARKGLLVAASWLPAAFIGTGGRTETWRALLGHESTLAGAWIANDGASVLTADGETVRYWKTSEFSQLDQVIEANLARDTFGSLSFNRLGRSVHGQYIAASRSDGAVVILEMKSELNTLFEMRPSGTEPFGVAFHPKREEIVAVSMRFGDLHIYDVSTQKVLHTLKTPGGAFSVAYSPDGKYLAAGGEGKVFLWSLLPQIELLATLTHDRGSDSGEVFSVTFDGTGRRLFAAFAGEALRVWEIGPLERVGQIQIAGLTDDERLVGSKNIAFSLDGQYFAASANYREKDPHSSQLRSGILLWRADKFWSVPSFLVGQEAPIWGMAFSPDSKRLASAGGNRVLMWSLLEQDAPPVIWGGHKLRVHDVLFSGDGERLISVEHGGVLIANKTSQEQLMEVACKRVARELSAEELIRFRLDRNSLPTC